MKPSKTTCILTIITALLSLYHLSFTLIDWKIQHKAEQQTIDNNKTINFDKSRAYLMEIWKKPVYNLFGLKYTYEQVKERSLKLGLDLQGGMHVTMELSPVEIVKGLATNHTDPYFLEALALAEKEPTKGQPTSFAKRFVLAYQTLAPQGHLKDFFITTDNQSRNYKFTHDQDIIKAIDQEISKALERSLTIIRSRLDRFGVAQTSIQCLPGTHRIQIELPSISNPDRVRKLLQGVAQLRFWEVANTEEYISQLESVEKLLLKEEKTALQASLPKGTTEAEKENIMPKQSVLSRLSSYSFPYRLAYPVEHMQQIEAILHREDVKKLLPNHIIWMWDKKEHCLKGDNQKVVILYPIKQLPSQKPLLEGDIITHATQSFDENGQPAVSMQMNSKSTYAWKRITANNIGKAIAITLDNRVYSAPIVNQEIPNGFSQISGNFTIEEAKDLASVLQTGSLPAPLKIVEESIIGPSLGKTAQHQGLVSSIIGLGLVLLFMALYYKRGGLIANLALCFNLLFIIGTLAQLDATLTLPGIAGLILTIGMSVDSNVLIFERIREELDNNIPLKAAIKRGYHKSYSSIIDSNITTFLSGAILYYFGQGQVRGFAIILMIGIISSIFSSIFLTKLVLAYLINNFPHIKLTFGQSPKCLKNLPLNFTKNRWRFYTFSILFLTIGGFCLYHTPLPIGIDFTGGRSYIIKFKHPIDASALSKGLSEKFNHTVHVRTYGANNIMNITTNYLNQVSSIAANEKIQHQLVTTLNQLTKSKAFSNHQTLDNDFCITGNNRIGSSVSQDIQKSTKKAVLLSLLGIFCYVALRFRTWRFGLAAVGALVHDTMTVIAGFSIAHIFGANYEINEVFIAAILTIIGYSINDTVVIFDRIREKLNASKTIKTELINDAIKETLNRTIITSFTTLLTVTILFIFGGEALRGFSFALLLGILFGTYSSICIATPLLIDLKKGGDFNH